MLGIMKSAATVRVETPNGAKRWRRLNEGDWGVIVAHDAATVCMEVLSDQPLELLDRCVVPRSLVRFEYHPLGMVGGDDGQ